MSNAPTPLPQRLAALCWRLPAAIGGSLTLAVLLAMIGLGVTGSTRGMLTHTTPTRGLAIALLPTVMLIAATLVGLISGTTVVACLVRETLTRHTGRLNPGWARAWRTLPKALLLLVLGVPAVLLSLLLWPAITAAFLARAAWRMRTPATRTDPTAEPRTGLWLAIPFTATVALAAAVPTTWGALVAGATLRGALTSSIRTRLRVRVAALAGLIVLGAASWGLGTLSLNATAARGASTGAFAAGTAALGLSTAVLIALAGTLLGLLVHTQHPTPTGGGTATQRPTRAPARGRFWRPARMAGVSTMVITTMLLPTGISALGAAASAFGATSSDIVVNTLTDSPALNPKACTAGATCGIRAALAKAATVAASGQSAKVVFDVSGQVNLTATLRVATGVEVNGNNNQVVLNAGHAMRALEAYVAGTAEGGGWVTLRDLTITGGRYPSGGAGLYASGTKVDMADMTFIDNISGPATGTVPVADRDGGAIYAPGATLRVADSTFTQNSARSGVGGAIAAGRINLSESTFVNNSGMPGQTEGGTVHTTDAGSSLLHATVIGGGGVSGTGDNPLVVTNSAVSTATAQVACANIADAAYGTIGNIDPAGTCAGKAAALDPLGPLADNGGPTQTIALLPGSPALGAADTDTCDYADQRGSGRDAATCDAGAYQASTHTIPAINVTLEVTPNPVTTTDQVRLQATLASDAQIPPGKVRFLDGSAPLASDLTMDGNQRFVATVGPLNQGRHQITAEFTPDDGNPAQTSDPTTLQVQAPVTMTVTGADPTRLHDPTTVTATITPTSDDAGTPAPEGTVTFTNGTSVEKVPVTGGVATWHTTSLSRSRVSAEYSGDDYHGVAVADADVTTVDLPTTIDLTAPATIEYGAPLTIDAAVNDAAGPVAGTATLEVDGVRTRTAFPLTDGKVSFTLAKYEQLGAGTHTVRVLADPEAGWTAPAPVSRTIEVTPATTSVSLDQPHQLVWSGGYETLGAGVTGVGTATLRLLDGTTVLDEETGVDLSKGTAAFIFHVYDTTPGTHHLTAQILASATVKGATSAPVDLVVTKAPSHINLSKAATYTAGTPATLTVFPGGDAVGTLSLTDSTGRVLATAPMDDNTVGLSWTPDAAGSTTLTVTLTPAADSNFAPTSTDVTLSVAAGNVARPDMTWSPVPVAGSTHLDVTFPATVPAVTGTVTLRNLVNGQAIGWGTVTDGTARIEVYSANVSYNNLQVSYGGDGNYNPATFHAPGVTIPAHHTVTTLDPVPAALPANSVLHLVSRTTATTTGFPTQGSVVFSVNGQDLLPVAVDPNGLARTTYQTTGPGLVRISAHYIPSDPIFAPSSSDEVTTTVSEVEAPVVTLSTNDSPTAGAAFTVHATATRFGFNIADGALLSVTDEDGNVVGTGTWSVTPFGATADLAITPRTGGPGVFTAHYTYGDHLNGTSTPLKTTVAATHTWLGLSTTTTHPVAGLPIFFTATLDTTRTPNLDAGPLKLQLNADGVPVGDPVTLARGARSVAMTTIATRRRGVTYSVTTTGDGTTYGSGAAYLPLTIDGSTPILSTLSDAVLKGRTWTSHTTLAGQPGLPAPTGTVYLTLTDNGGQAVASCHFDAPATGCTIDTAAVPDGLYTVATTYSGDSFYNPATTTGFGPLPTTLSVYSLKSDIHLTLTPAGTGYGWQVGEQVTATWTVTDPLSTATPTGSVAITYGAQNVCTAPATAGSCTFTAPANPRAGEQNPWLSSPVAATYTPAEALPAVTEVDVQGPRRCLPVTASIDASADVVAHSTAPVVTGTGCTIRDLPGLAGLLGTPGYLEGTQVSVSVPTVPAGYKVTGWHLEAGTTGRTWTNSDDTAATFTLTGPTTIAALAEWAPTCVTVTAGDNELRRRSTELDRTTNPDHHDFGYLELKTPSNCSSPTGQMSVPEYHDYLLGIGHYAVGTDVQAAPFATNQGTNPTAWNPQYTAIGVKGFALPDATHANPHAVVTKDEYIYGDYAIAPSMCTPVKLYAGIGGKLDVLSARPNPRFVGADKAAHCYTQTGQPGYYAYSTIETKATPDSPYTRKGHFQNRWFDDAQLATPELRAANLKDQAVAKYPDYSDPYLLTTWEYNHNGYWHALYDNANNYNPQFHGFEVPLRTTTADLDTAHLGVGFAEVRCAQLHLSLAVPVKSLLDFNGPTIHVTPSNCGDGGGYAYDQYNTHGQYATPERGQPSNPNAYKDTYTGQMTRNYEGTGNYVEGTKVTVSVDATTVTAGGPRTSQPGERTVGHDFSLIPGSAPRSLFWSVADNEKLTGATEAKGVSNLDIAMTGEKWAHGTYAVDNCQTPEVRVHPAGIGGYTVDPAASGACPDGKSDPNLPVILDADPVPGAPHLQAVWTMGRQREGDVSEVPDHQEGYGQNSKTTYVVSPQFLHNDVTSKGHAAQHTVDLYYCGKLNVTIGLRDINGNPLEYADRQTLGVTSGAEPEKYLTNGGSCPAPLMTLPGTTAQVGLNAAGVRKFEYAGAYLNDTKLPDGTVPDAHVNADGSSPDQLTVVVKPRCFTLKLGSKVAPSTKPNCPGAVEGQWEYLPGTVVVVSFTGDPADTFSGWNGTDKQQGTAAAVMMNQDRDVSAQFSTASGIELATKIISNIEQRIVSALVSAVTGAVAEFLFVAQLASLAVVGVADGLEALGVHGQGIDRLKDGANAIQAGIDVVSSLADCTQNWATGGGAPPFSPGSDIADRGISAGSDALGYAIDESSHADTRAAGVAGALMTSYSLTMMFSTGLEAYLQEPADSWANIVDIGSCVADTGRAAGGAAVQLGHH